MENKDFSAQYFLSSLSHQIRTPLNGIVGYTQLLSQTKLDKTQQSYINNMNNCSLQLISLINDILDFSKLTTGKAQIRNECFAFNEVIDEINSAVGFKVKEKRQKLRFVIEKDVPEYIISDKQKITQILINLISNANKFSPSDSRIIVGVSNGNEKNTVKITVEDNGIGISNEDQKKIFNPFVQVQDSLTKNGSGLGLAICKKLVELLGGVISIESEKGQGSIFTFTIRYESYEEFRKFVEKNGEFLKNKSILIADDDIDSRLMIGEMLFDSGMRPVICSSAKETLRMIGGKRYTFAAIIVDISMPDMSGTQISKQIKELEPEIPLIALSSLEESFVMTNFDQVLHKPVNKVKLLDVIYKLVNKNDITPFQLDFVEDAPIPVKKQGISILVAEDVNYNLEMLVKMLDTMGHKNVDTAKDGEEAIEKIDKQPYDIVLLDLIMPKKNGFEVAEHIKNKGMTCKVAVLSASVLDNDRDKCKTLGIKYFLLKPFSMTNLKIMINRLVNGTCK
jgi:CheY-like chemotaxis protein